MKRVGHYSELLFWHLPMNLEHKYLFKKLFKWANKKQNNFNIYNAEFFLKIKKNTWRYHYFTPVYQKSRWYDLQVLRYRAWKTEMGKFRLFFAKPKKSKFSNEKNSWISSFYTCVPKITIMPCMVPEIWSATDRIFCHFGLFFALLPT